MGVCPPAEAPEGSRLPQLLRRWGAHSMCKGKGAPGSLEDMSVDHGVAV